MPPFDSLPTSLREKFEILRLLGTGGFGAAYLVLQKNLDREVVLEVFHTETLEDPRAVARFRAEALLTSQLAHPNIVTVHDFGVDERVPWILYEYLAGATLREVLEARPLNFEEALSLTTDVLSALTAAHEASIIHRDIKIENVIRTPEGSLVDPGTHIRSNADVRKIDLGLKISWGAQPIIRRTSSTNPDHDTHVLRSSAQEWSVVSYPPWILYARHILPTDCLGVAEVVLRPALEALGSDSAQGGGR